MIVRDELQIVHETFERTRVLLQPFSRSNLEGKQFLRSAQSYEMFVTVRDELQIVHETCERTRVVTKVFVK